jgi:hypothetical protein
MHKEQIGGFEHKENIVKKPASPPDITRSNGMALVKDRGVLAALYQIMSVNSSIDKSVILNILNCKSGE